MWTSTPFLSLRTSKPTTWKRETDIKASFLQQQSNCNILRAAERESWRPAQTSVFLLSCIYISFPNTFLERENPPHTNSPRSSRDRLFCLSSLSSPLPQSAQFQIAASLSLWPRGRLLSRLSYRARSELASSFQQDGLVPCLHELREETCRWTSPW